tara:strand:+ start:3551 stop:3973 length:423 start_codon:yes stop_codon:yes gene_type:complete
MILETFANGASGVTYYWYGHFDAAHFKYHAEAINIVTPIEDIFMDGIPSRGLKCSHEDIKVCGMSLGSEQAVLVSNYQGVSPGTSVMIQTTAEPGTPIQDLHTGKTLGTIKQDGTFTVTIDVIDAPMYYIGRTYATAVAN